MPFDDVFHFAMKQGHRPDGSGLAHPQTAMMVFSRCNEFMAKVGLDADLDGGLPDDELKL